MPYHCRHCGAKVERIRKYCPECGRRMYKGDWVREDRPLREPPKKERKVKSTIERADDRTKTILGSADWLLPKKRRR